MLHAITIENAHRFGDVMPQLLRLRYRQFKERQSYNVRVHKNMEFDQYDTPETVYLVRVDDQNQVCGTSRLNPTSSPYMLKDIWPHMIEGHELPNTHDVWEGTRICIDKARPGHLRERIKWEIVLGYVTHLGTPRFVARWTMDEGKFHAGSNQRHFFDEEIGLLVYEISLLDEFTSNLDEWLFEAACAVAYSRGLICAMDAIDEETGSV